MKWHVFVLLARFYEFKTLDDFVEILAKRRSKNEQELYYGNEVHLSFRKRLYARQVSDFCVILADKLVRFYWRNEPSSARR